MNSVCSQEQEEGCLDRYCLDTGPLDMSNGMTTASESLPPESVTESCPMPLSSAISKHSSVTGTPQAIREWLTSLPRDSHVNPSPSPESKGEPTTSGICGRQQQSALELCAPDSFCLRTCRAYVPTCPWLSETCADLGMKFQDPLSLGLTTLGRRTEGNGCGYLHTPAQQEPGVSVERLQTKDGEPAKVGERAYDRETGRLAQVGLHQQIGMLSTPEAHPRAQEPRQMTGKHYPLANQIAAMIPTPSASERSGINPNTGRGEGLSKTVKMWPTMRAADGATHRLRKRATVIAEIKRDGRKNQHRIEDAVLEMEKVDPNGGSLNPTWVEWLMGWPLGWTDLKPLEMGRFRSVWLQRFAFCRVNDQYVRED